MDICVSNLPGNVTGKDLREVFGSFGRVETADVMKHPCGDESRGFGFVGMPDRSDAVSAVLGVQGRNLNGQAITATEVRPRDPVSGACRTRCHCWTGKTATGHGQSLGNGAPGAQARPGWKKIIGARSLIQSGFYNDPEIQPAVLDRCVTRILLDGAMSDR